MAVTVSGYNYTQFVPCDAITGEGVTWSETPEQDTDNKMEGTASLSFTLKSSGNNDVYASLSTGSWDLSGTKHLRLWGMFAHGGLIQTYASGGIQILISDGTNTAYWTVGGRDTYAGGWYNFVINVASTQTSGTKPTNMAAVTRIGFRLNLTGTAKNFDNTWIDNICVADGLTVYGELGFGSSFDFDDIYEGDAGKGIIRKIGGQYFLTGELIFDNTSGGCYFNAKSQVVVFEDRPVASGLYGITISDNGTNAMQWALGSSTGGQGVEGCVIRSEDPTQTPKWSFDATDTDIDNMQIYGSVFLDASGVSLPNYATNNEVLNTSFEQCGPVDVSTCTVTNCSIISPDLYGIIIDNELHNTTDTIFIMSGASTYGVYVGYTIDSSGLDFDGLVFYGTGASGPYDVYYGGTSDADINAQNGSNVNENYIYNASTGTLYVINAKTVRVTVIDAITKSAVPGAMVYLYEDNSLQTQIFKEQTDSSGIVETTSYNYPGTDVDVIGRVRKGTADPFYRTSDISGTITQNGFQTNVQLIRD